MPRHLLQSKIFTRTILGPSVNIHTLPSEDLFPPAKIIDLSIENNTEGRLTARWTSPGGDYLSGSVAGYNIVCSLDVGQMLDPAQEPEVVISINRTQVAGMVNREEMNIPYYDQHFYLGVMAVDQMGNMGSMSNLVIVFQQAEEAMQTGAEDTYLPLIDDDETVSEDDWMMLGVVCGVLLVFTVIITVIMTYCYCVQGSLSTNTSQENIAHLSDTDDATDDGQSDATDDDSLDAELKNVRISQEKTFQPTKYEDFAEPLNCRQLARVNMSGLTVLSPRYGQWGPGGQGGLSPYWSGGEDGDGFNGGPSPYVITGGHGDYKGTSPYLRTCSHSDYNGPLPHLRTCSHSDYNGPPSYYQTVTTAYPTHPHDYTGHGCTKHSTTV